MPDPPRHRQRAFFCHHRRGRASGRGCQTNDGLRRDHVEGQRTFEAFATCRHRARPPRGVAPSRRERRREPLRVTSTVASATDESRPRLSAGKKFRASSPRSSFEIMLLAEAVVNRGSIINCFRGFVSHSRRHGARKVRCRVPLIVCTRPTTRVSRLRPAEWHHWRAKASRCDRQRLESKFRWSQK